MTLVAGLLPNNYIFDLHLLSSLRSPFAVFVSLYGDATYRITRTDGLAFVSREFVLPITAWIAFSDRSSLFLI